jgi:hypothetical protein
VLVGWNETGRAGGGARLVRSEFWAGRARSRLEIVSMGGFVVSRPTAGETSSRGASSRGTSGRRSVSDMGATGLDGASALGDGNRNGRAMQRPAKTTPKASNRRDVFTMESGSRRCGVGRPAHNSRSRKRARPALVTPNVRGLRGRRTAMCCDCRLSLRERACFRGPDPHCGCPADKRNSASSRDRQSASG